MDVESVMVRMSELEDRLRQVTQERNNYASAIVNYEAFIGRIPRSLPGESGDSMTATSWLGWALEKLGYEKSE